MKIQCIRVLLKTSGEPTWFAVQVYTLSYIHCKSVHLLNHHNPTDEENGPPLPGVLEPLVRSPFIVMAHLDAKTPSPSLGALLETDGHPMPIHERVSSSPQPQLVTAVRVHAGTHNPENTLVQRESLAILGDVTFQIQPGHSTSVISEPGD